MVISQDEQGPDGRDCQGRPQPARPLPVDRPRAAFAVGHERRQAPGVGIINTWKGAELSTSTPLNVNAWRSQRSRSER